MKAKKYTNSSWTEGNFEKEFKTATDTYTTLPAQFQTSGADVGNYEVFGASSGVGEETENLVPEIRTANGWRPGYYSAINGYVSNNANGEWLSPLIDIGSMTSVTITYKRLAEGTTPSETISFFDSNGNFISNKTDSTNAHATFNDFPSGASKFCYAFRSYCFTEQEIIENEMQTCCVSGSTAPTTYIPFGYKIPILNTSGVTENLFDWNTVTLGKRIQWNTGNDYADATAVRSDYVPVKYNQTYVCTQKVYFIGYDNQLNYLGAYSLRNNAFNKEDPSQGAISAFTNPDISCKYIKLISTGTEQVLSNASMFVEGSTAPDHYIPHRYTSNYNLFLGDSKLYEDEYLDFVEQKVYRYVDGVLTPQDPPAPFPALHTYIGENNLSVDTTVQPEKVELTVAAWREIEGEKYQNGEWSDNNDI